MEHEEYLEWMSAALDGQLPPAQRIQLEEHLRTCPSCAQLYEELSQQSAALRGLDCPLPPHLHENILNQLSPQVPQPRPRKMWKVFAPLAACLALVAALGYASLSRPGADTPSMAARSDPGLAPAVYSIQPQNLAVPDGDTVLLLSAPLSQSGQELLTDLPTNTLEGGFLCCVVGPDTAQAVTDLLHQTGQGYTQSAAAAPDGSGDTAIVWPAA